MRIGDGAVMRMLVRLAIVMLVLAVAGHAQAAAPRLSRIFQDEMLTARIAYLEQITGPAIHIRAAEPGVQLRDYKVEGCSLSAYAKGGAVVAYTLALTKDCNFNLDDLLGNDYPSTAGLTVGQFANGAFGADLRAQSSCIDLCSNAADPTVDFTFAGPHAANFLTVILTVVLDDDAAVDAVSKWRDVMRAKEGDNYIIRTRFNCDTKYDAAALAAFAKVKVTRITVGHYQPNARLYRRGCRR